MKKLKLKLDGKVMLSKEQMKKIAGGYCNGGTIIWCQYIVGGGSITINDYCCGTWGECALGFAYACGSDPNCVNAWCTS